MFQMTGCGAKLERKPLGASLPSDCSGAKGYALSLKPHEKLIWAPHLRQIAPKSIFGTKPTDHYLPIIVMQMIVPIIFFNAHWATVTA